LLVQEPLQGRRPPAALSFKLSLDLVFQRRQKALGFRAKLRKGFHNRQSDVRFISGPVLPQLGFREKLAGKLPALARPRKGTLNLPAKNEGVAQIFSTKRSPVGRASQSKRFRGGEIHALPDHVARRQLPYGQEHGIQAVVQRRIHMQVPEIPAFVGDVVHHPL